MAYHPAVFFLLWVILSPLYLVMLLFLAMALLPVGYVIPVFVAAFPASALLLPFFGRPRLKPPAPPLPG